MIQSRRVGGNPLFFYLSCVTANKTNFPKDSTALSVDKFHRWSHNLASCKGDECLIFAVTVWVRLKFLLFCILTFHIGVSFSLCFLPLFLSIWLSFAFFQTFFARILHMKFHFPLCGNSTTTANWAPHGASPGSLQDSHRQRMEYHVKHINYIVTMPGFCTWSLSAAVSLPLI